jgi:hypothetical protein
MPVAAAAVAELAETAAAVAILAETAGVMCWIDSDFAEFHYAECHYVECHYAECHYAEFHYAECHYVECHCAECSFFVKTNVLKQVHVEHLLSCISIGKVCWQNFWQYHAMITPALLALAFLGSTASIGEFRFQFHFFKLIIS